MDCDYEENEMTKEQKEVFECLQNEDERQVYEDLEDDFIDLIKGDQKVINIHNKKPNQSK